MFVEFIRLKTILNAYMYKTIYKLKIPLTQNRFLMLSVHHKYDTTREAAQIVAQYVLEHILHMQIYTKGANSKRRCAYTQCHRFDSSHCVLGWLKFSSYDNRLDQTFYYFMLWTLFLFFLLLVLRQMKFIFFSFRSYFPAHCSVWTG